MTASYKYFCVLFILWMNILALTADGSRNSCRWRGCKDGPGKLKCQSCISGCYGSECRHSCRRTCDVHGCNRRTGICVRCEPGYHGEMCDMLCSKGCSSSIKDDIADCDRYTGFCLEHCTRGKTGRHCAQTCPTNCKNSVCDKQRGTCFLGCKPGWQGTYCNKPCGNCLEGRCADNGHCTTNCKPGFYGDLCDKRCSHNGKRCYRTGCDRQTGRCDQCSPGYHGDHCNKRCNSNCHKGGDDNRDCDRYTGRCLEGCESGWHGSHCNTPCSENCKRKECYNPQGRCTYGCENGWYGSHCRSTCSENCQSRLCNQHTGLCVSGCKKGFFGKRCDKRCGNCDHCEQDSGRCSKCPKGFCGITCSETCSANCNGGICDINGNCTNGCKNNVYYGHMCENECNQDCLKCDQTTGDCITKVERYIGNESSYFSSGALETDQNIIFCFCIIVLRLLVGDVP